MSPCEWEFPAIMVKCSLHTSCGMAFIAWQACKGVSSDSIMLAVHRRLIMVMTVNATE